MIETRPTCTGRPGADLAGSGAEGAGAASMAAALAGRAGKGNIVCIVSGGNIDAARLAAILKGEMPV